MPTVSFIKQHDQWLKRRRKMHLGVVSFEERKQFHFNGIAAVPDYSFFHNRR